MPIWLVRALVLLHLAVVAFHDAAHVGLNLLAGAAASVYIVFVIHLMPLGSALLLWRRRWHSGLVWGLWGFLGSFLFGTYNHFIHASPDHVSHIAGHGWGAAFQVTAWALGAVDFAGIVVVLAAARALLPRGACVLLLDGTCVFCNRLASHVLAHDKARIFYFAHLQSDYGREALRAHGAEIGDVDGVYMLVHAGTPEERLVVDGAAGRLIWPSLYVAATPLVLVPAFILDPVYRAFARVRYRLYGRYDSCRVPTGEERERFLTAASQATFIDTTA